MSPITRFAALVGLTIARFVGQLPSSLYSDAVLMRYVAAIPQATYSESEITVPYPSATLSVGAVFDDPSIHLVPVGTAATNTTYLFVAEQANDATLTVTYTGDSPITYTAVSPATTYTGKRGSPIAQ